MIADANLTADRKKIVEIVRRFGVSASDAILDPNCSIFNLPHIEGLIGYYKDLSCAIVYGPPLVSNEFLKELVTAFHDYCREQNMNIIYVSATKEFAQWAKGKFYKILIEFGEELIMDPHNNPKANTGTKGSLVRRKVKHAIKEGVSCQEYLEFNPDIEQYIENVRIAWLKNRQGPQIHISNVYLFENREGKRWFFASCDNTIVATVVLHQIQSKKGWHVNHLMHTEKAPNGTPELLLTSTLEVLAKEGCHFVSFGPATQTTLGEIQGLKSFGAFLCKTLFLIANKIFPLQGRRKFWDKFQPSSEVTYLLFNQSTISYKDLNALRRALHIS